MKAIVTCILVFCVGCPFQVPADHTFQLYVDPEGFTGGEISDIYSAASDWERQTDGLVHLDIVTIEQGTHLIKVASADKGSLGARTTVGTCYRDGSSTQTISLVPITKGTLASWFVPVATHEIGHCLGLDHDVPGTIMCASMGPYGCASRTITCRDVQRLCEVWHCFADGMPACAK